MSVEVKGLQNILSNLNKQIQKIENKTLIGLRKATNHIRNDMEVTPPKIPVDKGNLKNSWFVVSSSGSVITGKSPSFVGELANKIKGGHSSTLGDAILFALNKKGPFVVFGFGAYYAAYVHEMIEANFSKHGTGALFLSNAIARNSKMVLKIIASEVKKK